MPGLYFDSGIDDGFEKDLDKINTELNKVGKTAESTGSRIDKAFERAFSSAPKSLSELKESIQAQTVTVKDLENQYKSTAAAIDIPLNHAYKFPVNICFCLPGLGHKRVD